MEIDDHLQTCRRCRTVHQVLEWSGAGRGQLVWEPSTDLLARLKAVPQLVESRHPQRAVRGRLTFDSWKDQPSLSVRKAPFGVERRMRFEASHYVLDLVGDRQLDGWHFVARVTDRETVSRQFILRVGRRKLHPGTGGCFFWTAKRPPRRLCLLSSDLKIDLEQLRW